MVVTRAFIVSHPTDVRAAFEQPGVAALINAGAMPYGEARSERIHAYFLLNEHAWFAFRGEESKLTNGMPQALQARGLTVVIQDTPEVVQQYIVDNNLNPLTPEDAVPTVFTSAVTNVKRNAIRYSIEIRTTAVNHVKRNAVLYSIGVGAAAVFGVAYYFFGG